MFTFPNRGQLVADLYAEHEKRLAEHAQKLLGKAEDTLAFLYPRIAEALPKAIRADGFALPVSHEELTLLLNAGDDGYGRLVRDLASVGFRVSVSASGSEMQLVLLTAPAVPPKLTVDTKDVVYWVDLLKNTSYERWASSPPTLEVDVVGLLIGVSEIALVLMEELGDLSKLESFSEDSRDIRTWLCDICVICELVYGDAWRNDRRSFYDDMAAIARVILRQAEIDETFALSRESALWIFDRACLND